MGKWLDNNQKHKKLIQIDYSGNIVDEKLLDWPDEFNGKIDAIYQGDDGSYYFTWQLYVEEGARVAAKSILIKTNQQFEFEWRHDLNIDNSFQAGLNLNAPSIIQSHNPENIILAGQYPVKDSLSGKIRVYAFLSEINKDEEVVWHKRYSIIDQDESEHIISDIKQTADGGYLCLGLVNYLELFEGEVYGSRTFIFKVDGEGNLKKLVTLNKENEKIENNSLSIFPNPLLGTSLSYNILKSQVDINNQIIFYNTQGTEVLRKKIGNSEGKIDVSALSPGIYYIVLLKDKKIIGTQTIINV